MIESTREEYKPAVLRSRTTVTEVSPCASNFNASKLTSNNGMGNGIEQKANDLPGLAPES